MLGGLVVVVVLSMLISIMLALVLAVVLALVLAPLTIKDRYGRSLLTRMSTHLAWRRAVKKGSTLYRSGPLGGPVTARARCRPRASSVLTEAQDSYGRPFAMLTYPAPTSMWWYCVVTLTGGARRPGPGRRLGGVLGTVAVGAVHGAGPGRRERDRGDGSGQRVAAAA
ncbi:hypothetical protein [Streptomyces sp. Wb2n-11]|uniref:hypothetical protein n=1 Tax=Streptomyces sp. Wb2n-11 TaxID=1030533 RepID=UPI000B0B8B98|nr:hypothetical protein [Streptomyces sp. Wb2n-11]